MKKIITTAIAASLVLSMAAVASAAVNFPITDIGQTPHTWDSTDYFAALNGKLPYGETVYYGFTSNGNHVTEYDAVKGMSIKQSWELNGSAIERIEVVKKKHNAGSNDYMYALSVKAKNNTTTKDTDVVGTIKLNKSSEPKYTGELSVQLTLGYDKITDADTIYNELKLLDFSKDSEQLINFEGADSTYFTVDTTGQSALLAKYDVKFNSDVANKYPSANLDFFNGHNVTFNKTGEMTLAASEGSYLYQINAEGKLVPVKANYDEHEGAFKFKTRTIGNYVMSDRELDIVNTPASSGSSNNGDTSKPNPGTGARV